eukprot:m.60306 g.60306  ORF g.60306 m.60306 type:complete len:286 (+) comp7936_c0_seq2:358-1215(+)
MKCVRAVLNREDGINAIIDEAQIESLTLLLSTNDIPMKQLVYELLSAICLYSEDGCYLVVESFDLARELDTGMLEVAQSSNMDSKEGDTSDDDEENENEEDDEDCRQFSACHNGLAIVVKDLFDETAPIQYLKVIVSFINALHFRLAPKHRILLRREMIAMDLLDALAQVQSNARRNMADENASTLLRQCDLFLSSFQEDVEDLKESYSLDINNPIETFVALFKKMNDSTHSMQAFNSIVTQLVIFEAPMYVFTFCNYLCYFQHPSCSSFYPCFSNSSQSSYSYQ